MKPVVMLVLAALLPAPAAASDFSALGKPEFARRLLLPDERRQEIACAQHWHLAGRVDLRPISHEIRTRLGIEIGSKSEAAKTFEFLDLDESAMPELRENWARIPNLEAARCDRIAAAFVRHGPAAYALLARRASGPIALPSTGYCLAQLEQGLIAKDQPDLAGTARELREKARQARGLRPHERASIERDYASFATTVPIANWAAIRGTEVADLICFPALSSLAARLRGDR